MHERLVCRGVLLLPSRAVALHGTAQPERCTPVLSPSEPDSSTWRIAFLSFVLTECVCCWGSGRQVPAALRVPAGQDPSREVPHRGVQGQPVHDLRRERCAVLRRLGIAANCAVACVVAWCFASALIMMFQCVLRKPVVVREWHCVARPLLIS